KLGQLNLDSFLRLFLIWDRSFRRENSDDPFGLKRTAAALWVIKVPHAIFVASRGPDSRETCGSQTRQDRGYPAEAAEPDNQSPPHTAMPRWPLQAHGLLLSHSRKRLPNSCAIRISGSPAHSRISMSVSSRNFKSSPYAW